MRWSRRRHQRARRQQRRELERMGESIRVIAQTGMTRLGGFYCIARGYDFRWNPPAGEMRGLLPKMLPSLAPAMLEWEKRVTAANGEMRQILTDTNEAMQRGEAFHGAFAAAQANVQSIPRGPATTPPTAPFKGPHKSRKARGL